MAINWRVYGKDTVACKLSKEDIPGFFRKQVTIGPNEAAVIVKNGEVKETVTESTVNVTDYWDRLKGQDDFEIYMIDISPIDFTIFLGESTKSSKTGAFKESESTEKDEKDPPKRNIFKFWKKDNKQDPHSKNIIESKEKFSVGGVKVVRSRKEVYDSLEKYAETSLNTSDVTLLGVTLDNEIISAECHLRVSVLLDDAKVFTGIMRGRTALATWDLIAIIRDELLAKVLIPTAAQYRSDEFRGNRELFNKITDDVRSEMVNSFNLWGMTLEDFTINWGLTEAELHEIEQKRLKREEEAKDFTNKRRLADLKRDLDIDKAKIDNLKELKIAESKGDEELKDLLLASDISRDLLIEGKRVDIETIDAEIRAIQLGVEKKESDLRIETDRNEELLRLEIQDKEFKQKQADKLANVEIESKEMQDMVRMQIQMTSAKHDREMESRRVEIDADFRRRRQDAEDLYQQRKIRLEEDLARMGMIERVLSQGITSGTADASVLRTMLEQSTEQSFATSSDDKVKSRENAKAAEHNLDTFKNAENREREHQKDMTKLSTDMMQASKQKPGEVVFTGGNKDKDSNTPSNVNIINSSGQDKNDSSSSAEGLKCPNCNDSIQASWKACPHCGQSLAPAKCSNCGYEIKPGWKACPQCGEKL